MGRRRDAALAFVVAIPVATGVVIVRPAITRDVVLFGVVSTLLLEAVMMRHRSRIRVLWGDGRVQAFAVLGTLVAVAIGVCALGASVLVVVLSGLVTYLVLLAVVQFRD